MLTPRCSWVVVLACGCLVGCTTLPDTHPFTDATVAFGSAVASTGSAVVSELKSTPLPQVGAQAARLEEGWAARNQAMSALIAYANSVQAITNAGLQGEQSATKLADAAKSLTDSLSVASLGASAAGGLAIDTLTFAYGQIAKAHAAKSLEASLAEMQPAIIRIAELFATDLRVTDEIVTLTIRAERDALADANQAQLAYRRQLIATQNQLMGSIRAELAENKKPSELSHVEELNRIAAMIVQQDAWYAGYEREQRAIAERGRLAHELIASTETGFRTWANAHEGLLAAVRAKQPPSAVELLAAVGRINGLVERYRAL